MKRLLAFLIMCGAAFPQAAPMFTGQPGAIPFQPRGYLPATSDPAKCIPGVSLDVFRTDLGVRKYCSANDTWTQYGAGSAGTVTSVGLSLPAWFAVANSPVVGSATLTVTAATGQTSHQVIGTCNTATSFSPCSLVAGDIPAIPIATGLSGFGSGVTTALAIAHDTTGGICTVGGSGCPGTISGLTTNKIPKATSSTTIGDSSFTDNGTTVATTEPFTAPSLSSGGTPPTCTAGTGGCIAMNEGIAPSICPTAGVDCSYADSTQHNVLDSLNNGAYYPRTHTIASGTATLGTSLISNGACATAVIVSATGVATTDVIDFSPNASLKAVTGFTPGGGLSIREYPTSGNVNFEVCNETGSPITPGSAVTLNWSVRRP